MAEMTNKSVLLCPFGLRGLLLKNRVVMAPLTRSRADEMLLPNALMAEYYAQLAAAGLIITEATVVSKQGIGWLNSLGIYADEQAEAWEKGCGCGSRQRYTHIYPALALRTSFP